MNKAIVEALDYKLKYDPNIQKQFSEVLNLRYDKNAQVIQQFSEFTKGKNIASLLEDEAFAEELKRLNLMNLKERLSFIEETKAPETVVITYMRALLRELERSTSLYEPSTELIESEKIMLDHLLNGAHLNEELTGFENISNLNLRIVLQTWLLYPEYLKYPEILEKLLECLSVTSCRL